MLGPCRHLAHRPRESAVGRDRSYTAKSGFVFREVASATTANTDVNHNALSEFKPGDMVRAVIVLHTTTIRPIDRESVLRSLITGMNDADRFNGNTLHLTAAAADVGDTVATVINDVDRLVADLQVAVDRLRAIKVAT